MPAMLPETTQATLSPLFECTGCLVFFIHPLSVPRIFWKTTDKSQIKPDFKYPTSLGELVLAPVQCPLIALGLPKRPL
jgi:hypothetical protein